MCVKSGQERAGLETKEYNEEQERIRALPDVPEPVVDVSKGLIEPQAEETRGFMVPDAQTKAQPMSKEEMTREAARLGVELPADAQ